MAQNIQFGIGFFTGRDNVCKIINHYYKDILEQGEKFGRNVDFTIFILYDLEYQNKNRSDFYAIKPEVYERIKIKYITPEDIEEEKKILESRYNFDKKDVDLILGHGYARARNSIMYFALKRKIDYLLFWDDDEYLVANIKNKENKVEWVKQDDILQHLKSVENADVTVGYRCGNMSPVPHIETNLIKGEDFKYFIDGVSNEFISWDKVKSMKKEIGGISFADEDIVFNGKPKIIENVGTDNWLYASGICINLKHIKNIPAFYNPPFARGEDTFWCTLLKNNKIIRVPTYHFHDGFLNYTKILEGKYPKTFNKINLADSVEKRFFKASVGWIKYKPLLIYITNRKNYRKIINESQESLQRGIVAMNEVFKTNKFNVLIEELNNYDRNVKKHYNEYIRTNEVWNELKKRLDFENSYKKEIIKI